MAALGAVTQPARLRAGAGRRSDIPRPAFDRSWLLGASRW